MYVNATVCVYVCTQREKYIQIHKIHCYCEGLLMLYIYIL